MTKLRAPQSIEMKLRDGWKVTMDALDDHIRGSQKEYSKLREKMKMNFA